MHQPSLFLLCGIASVLMASSPGLAQASPDDAVLSDPAFEASLPPLDATQAPPAATPPAVTEPPPDTELAAPLPPLATYNATPAPALADAGEKAAVIRYDVVIKGLEPVNLHGRFRELSALLRDGRKAANAAQISARADEDVKLGERLLRSEGYYDAVVTSSVDTLPNARDRLTVTVGNAGPPLYAGGDQPHRRASGTGENRARRIRAEGR